MVKFGRTLALGLLLAGISGLSACQSVTDSEGNSYLVESGSAAFKGDFVQSDGKTIPMTLKEGKPVRVEYPTIGCKGRLEEVKRTMNEVTFIEHVESGSCIDGGTIVTSMSGRSIINLNWTKQGNGLTATARLFRNGKKPAAGTSRIGGFSPKTVSSDQILVQMKFGTPSRPYTKSGTVGLLGVKMADYTESYIDIPVSLRLSLDESAQSTAIKRSGKTVYAAIFFAVRDKLSDKVDYINLPGKATGCYQNLMILSKENDYQVSYDIKHQFAIRSDINARILVEGKIVDRETAQIQEFYDIKKTALSPFGISRREGRRFTCYGNADERSWPMK